VYVDTIKKYGIAIQRSGDSREICLSDGLSFSYDKQSRVECTDIIAIFLRRCKKLNPFLSFTTDQVSMKYLDIEPFDDEKEEENKPINDLLNGYNPLPK
jgi:hypothetical protein